MRLAPAVHQLAGVLDHLVAHLERLVRVEAQHLLGGGHLLVAQRRAVHAAGVHLRRRGIADDGAHRDERRLVGDGLRGLDGFFYPDDVLTALDLLDVPAVGPVALQGVLGQRDVGVVLDRDLVAVVEHDQVPELLGAGQRRGLAGDALLDVAVGGDHVDVVVERAGAGRCIRIEQAAFVARGHRHADRRGQALPERAGGDLHTEGVPELRVARGLGAPGAQRLDVGELQAETAEVQLQVQGEAAVPAGQDEPVAAQPVGVAGVVPHHPLEQRVGQRRQAHRRAGVSVADLLHRVGGQDAHRVDGQRIDVGPVIGMVRLGQRGNLFAVWSLTRSWHRQNCWQAGVLFTLVPDGRLLAGCFTCITRR